MARPVGATPFAARRRPRPRLILLALLIVPVAEIAAIVAVGRLIGGWATLALLLVTSLVGAWLIRHEGLRTWRALDTALATGAMPSRELADAALVFVGGALLLLPGFLTDLIGLFFTLPITRPITRRWLAAAVQRRLLASGARTASGPAPFGPMAGEPGFFGGAAGQPGGGPADRRSDVPHAPGRGQTVEGEILDR